MMQITPATASDRKIISGAVIYSRLIMKPPSLSESTKGHCERNESRANCKC